MAKLALHEESTLTLRPYQTEQVAAWQASLDRAVQRSLIIAATGTGKTATIANISRIHLEEDSTGSRTILIIAHRHELLEQIKGALEAWAPELDVAIHSGRFRAKPGVQVVIGSVQSLSSRAEHEVLRWLKPSLVICDEAHHAPSVTYQNVFRNAGCYDADGAQLLGVTATPHRLDNKAMVGEARKAIFEEIIHRYDIAHAVKDGWLVDLTGYQARADLNLENVREVAGEYVRADLERAMNTDPLNELAFRSWSDVAKDRQTIAFCAGVEHAKAVAEVFTAHGVSARAVWGDMPRIERDRAIDDFRAGCVQVLTNMDILTEGFDARECAAVMLLRPTKSWTLYTQMVGRGARPLPGIVDGIESAADRRTNISRSAKPNCVIIDMVENSIAHNVTKRRDGTGVPSLQELVGLPSTLELEGQGVCEALEVFDELPEAVKAAARKRSTTFRGLQVQLTQISLLTEVDSAEEAEEGGAEFFWLKIGEFEYSLSIGRTEHMEREAILSQDELGNWSLVYKLIPIHPRDAELARSRTFTIDPAEPWRSAESIIRQNAVGVERLASRAAPWRQAPITELQKRKLLGFGLDAEVVETLTRGKASGIITHMERTAGKEVA